jgi:exosortase K
VKTKLCVLAVTALVIWGMKRHYADAGADDLWWILTPTARVVGAMTGTAFVAVPSEGYVSHERLFVIEKSCAGINFLVAAFGMLIVALLHRIRSGLSGFCVLGASLLASYAAAIFVNATRITIAMWLADRPSALSALTSAQVHRLEGIVVYFAGLVLLCELARRVERRTGLAGRTS